MSSNPELKWKSEEDQLPAQISESASSVSRCRFTSVNSRGEVLQKPCNTMSSSSPTPIISLALGRPGTHRVAILDSAQRICHILPKKRKAPINAQRNRKRRISSSKVNVAEDPRDVEEVPQVSRQTPDKIHAKPRKQALTTDRASDDVSTKPSGISLRMTSQLSAMTLNKLEASKQKPDPTNSRPTGLRKLSENTSVATNQDDGNEMQRKAGVWLFNGDTLTSAGPDQSSSVIQIAHLDGYTVAQQRRLLQELKANNRWPAQVQADISGAATEAACSQLAVEASQICTEEAFEEDDTIFDQLIAGDEAGTYSLVFTPKAAQIPFSKPAPIGPAPSLAALFPATPPTLTQTITPSGVSALPPPPLKPTFRASLPSPAPTISPIPNLTPHVRVPTCFRIGEALRLLSPTTSRQVRAIELYALVVSSSRRNGVQLFQLADLYFPQRPPYLHGTYAAWTKSELFEQDSAAFVKRSDEGQNCGEAMICRAIIRTGYVPKNAPEKDRCRDFTTSPLAKTPVVPSVGSGGVVTLVEILSIWKCDWDDIGYVRGIVVEEDMAIGSAKEGREGANI